jgi:hypothetical protein
MICSGLCFREGKHHTAINHGTTRKDSLRHNDAFLPHVNLASLTPKPIVCIFPCNTRLGMLKLYFCFPTDSLLSLLIEEKRLIGQRRLKGVLLPTSFLAILTSGPAQIVSYTLLLLLLLSEPGS